MHLDFTQIIIILITECINLTKQEAVTGLSKVGHKPMIYESWFG